MTTPSNRPGNARRRLALISDIHANAVALDAVLAALAADPVDQVVCLGDVAATGPQPREVVARLRALACPVILGNADAFLLDPSPAAAGDEDARRLEAIDQWCAEQMTEADLDFLRTFRPTIELPLAAGRTLLAYHGSPRSYGEVIAATTPDDLVRQMLAGRRALVLAGGHWHFQLLRRFEDALLVNPGSVGLAYDLLPDGAVRVPPRAEYAILATEGDTLSLDFKRVPYDRDATVRLMFERGMPHAAWWSEAWRR